MNTPETSKPPLKLMDVVEQTYVLPLEAPQNGADHPPEPAPQFQTMLTDFAELQDGTLIELVADPADANHALLEQADGADQEQKSI